MKQAFYKLFFVVLFIGIITVISGSPESRACDTRSVKKACIIQPKQITEENPDHESLDAFFFNSIFQI